MTRASDLEEQIEGGWPELIDMMADAMSDEGGQKNPEEAFFYLYAFMFRLYYRLKVNPVKQPFNQYSLHGDEFWISNYDYNTFKWAVQHGFTEEIDNLVIKIPENKLTQKQIAALKRRCE